MIIRTNRPSNIIFILYLCLSTILQQDDSRGVESFVIGSFVTSKINPHSLLQSHPNSEAHEEDSELYDDFGEFVPGKEPIQFNEINIGEDYSYMPQQIDYGQLTSLVAQSFQQEVARDSRIALNWRRGNWKVRGFSLDKYTYDSTMSNQTRAQRTSTEKTKMTSNTLDKENFEMQSDPLTDQPIYVSKVIMERTNIDDDNHHEKDVIVVGRTDGSIVIVRLGTEILTKFVENYNQETEIERVFQRQETMIASDDTEYNTTRPVKTGKPFQVLSSLQAHGINEPITAMVLFDDKLYTAAGASGDFKIWKLEQYETPEIIDVSSQSDDKLKIIPVQTISGTHSGKIVSLTTLSSRSSSTGDFNTLLSASDDGSFALWDLSTSTLLAFQNVRNFYDVNDESLSINCVDVYENIIALGLNNGQIMVFDSDHVIDFTRKGIQSIQPLCSFSSGATSKAPTSSNNEGKSDGITAIGFAGRGSLTPLDQAGISYTLITGDSTGVVKQWELLTRIVSSTSPLLSDRKIKMEYWPRMSTQRMKKKAHVFMSSHAGPVSALVSTSSRVISAGKDGSVIISNPITGEELYRMDGFTKDIRSLCLDDGILVTDGMEEYIAIHDFDVTDDDTTTSFEME